uniref:Transposase (Putative), gypsy type n=1 Tax=Tanacetum cinerariifolium TaxID=118510 RepID=A0A699HQF4_TANCI|nr:hypothetical protein [Tanacetum cinerariifolium]
MGRDTIQLEIVVSTISQEYLLEFTYEYDISEDLHPELPGLEERIVDFSEGKNNRFFWVDERVFHTVMDWRVSAPKDEMPVEDTYSPEAVAVQNTQRTPIQKQPEELLCLVGLIRRYFLGEDVYPIFLHDDDRDMNLFNLIRALNPTKVKIGTHPRASHESTVGGKSLASMGLETRPTFPVPTLQKTPADISDSDPLSFANPQSSKGAAIAGDPESEYTSFTSVVGSPESIYQPEWGVTNGCHLDTLEACQDLQVSTLQAQVTGEEKLKAAFEAFKKYENDRVEKHCAEMDARLDALSIDFDEELYPHMLIAIIGHRWVNGHGLRLAVIKCGESTEQRQVFADVVSARIAKCMSEGIKYGLEHVKANLDLEAIEAYDSEADTKYVTALRALRDLKYPMVDQLESLKDALIDVIMASLHLESDSGEDAPQCIRELRPMPIVAPQDLAILLADAATQMETSKNEVSPRLLRSKSLPAMHNLDWP